MTHHDVTAGGEDHPLDSLPFQSDFCEECGKPVIGSFSRSRAVLKIAEDGVPAWYEHLMENTDEYEFCKRGDFHGVVYVHEKGEKG